MAVIIMSTTTSISSVESVPGAVIQYSMYYTPRTCSHSSALLYKVAPFSRVVEVQDISSTWKDWKDLDGHFDYYIFKTKGINNGCAAQSIRHRGLIVKCVDSDTTLKVELMVNDNGWYICI